MWNKVKEKSSGFAHNRDAQKSISILLSLAVPISLLYIFYPSSFTTTWGNGRGMYLIFLWLLVLEFILFRNQISSTPRESLGSVRTLALAISMIIPTTFVLAAFFTGLDQLVVELGRFLRVPSGSGFGDTWIKGPWRVGFESLVLATFFTTSILLMYGKAGIKKLSVGCLFLWSFAILLLIDTFNPYGRLGLLQIFVPSTVESAAGVLRLIGYHSTVSAITDPFFGPGSVFTVSQNQSIFAVLVYWPSAGVNSLFIYTLTMLLFIQNVAFSAKKKAIIFVVGAAGTFTANVLRIVTIGIIGLRVGSAAAFHFHDYYGEFFFISWILIYLTIIFLAQRTIGRVKLEARRICKPQEIGPKP